MLGNLAVRNLVLVLGLSALLLDASVVLAADKSGVKPQVLSLPSGPGSIEGLGPSFEPQLNTGSAPYSFEIAVPPGRAGHEPKLALSYNSGSGNGHFGIGWTMSLPAISRQIDKGQPTYSANDILIYSNGEELVPIADGTYRCENESDFMRFQRVGDGWEVKDRSGRLYKLGTTAASRVQSPDHAAAGFNGTYKWYVDEFVDTNGNRILYSYTSFPDSPGELYLSEVRYNLSGGSNFNSVAIDYQRRPDAFTDYRSGFAVRTGRRGYRIRVTSRGSLVRQYGLEYSCTYAYDPQNDTAPPFGQCNSSVADEAMDPDAAGAVPLEFSLLVKVTQFEGCVPGTQCGIPTPVSYLPPLRFGYTRLKLGGLAAQQMANAPLNVTFLGSANADLLDVNGDTLPDVLVAEPEGQTWYENLGRSRFRAGAPLAMGGPNPGVPLGSTAAIMADMDGDGLSDYVLRPGSGQLRYQRNRGDGTLAPPVDFTSAPLFGINGSDVRMMDVNFDKAIDVIQSTAGNSWQVCINSNTTDVDLPDPLTGTYGNFPGPEDIDHDGDGVLEGSSFTCTTQAMPFPPQVRFGVSSVDVQLADMNGDRLQDVVYLQATAAAKRVVWYWPNKGNGRFASQVIMSQVGAGGQAAELDLGSPLGTGTNDTLKISDLNGDGLSDLVKIENGAMRLWVNLGGDTWSLRSDIVGVPEYDAANTSLRVADMNGNGSQDIVYIKATGPTDQRWQYVDFTPSAKPNQLRLIDNGLGRRITIDYASSTDFYVAARDDFSNPWTLKSPTPMQVVRRVTTDSGLEPPNRPELDVGVAVYVTDFAYRDAYYDPWEKEFRGFAFAKKIERGDVDAPTLVTRMTFHTGAPDDVDNDGDGLRDERTVLGGVEEESLKGRVLRTEQTCLWNGTECVPDGIEDGTNDGTDAPDSAVFRRTVSDWQIRQIHAPSGGARNIATRDERNVSFAFNAGDDTQVIELGQGTPKLLRVTRAYDNFGNQTLDANQGVVDPPAGGDERYTQSTFSNDVTTLPRQTCPPMTGAPPNQECPDDQRWILDRACRVLVTDAQANPVSETLSYYDGDDYEGLDHNGDGTCPADRGNLKREQAWVGPGEYVEKVRNAHDPYGNVTAIADPNWNSGTHPDPTGSGVHGHLRKLTYDPTFTLPVQERIHVGGGSSDLVMTADYDFGFGVMTGSTDFNGNPTSYGYDSFGRLTSITKPGDSTTLPTTIYTYGMTDPVRAQSLVYGRTGALQVLSTSRTASWIATSARETAGQGAGAHTEPENPIDGTFEQIQYVDGMGRKLAKSEEDEPGFVVQEAVRFNARASVRDTLQPYDTSSPLTPFTAGFSLPGGAAQTAMRYDAVGREVRKLNPDETAIGAPIQCDSGHRVGNACFVTTAYAPLVKSVFDQLANEMSYANDGLDRLVQVQEVNGGERSFTNYAYNPADSLLTITDAQSNVKTFVYDGLQRQIFMNDPDRGIVTFGYDAASNLTLTSDAKGQQIAFGYDGINRLATEDFLDEGLAEVSYGLSPDVIYHYDDPAGTIPFGDGTGGGIATNTKGFLSWVQDLAGEEHTSYDARGRIAWTVNRIADLVDVRGAARHTWPVSTYRSDFVYDSRDRVTRVGYPDNDRIDYRYNSRSLLDQIVGASNGTAISTRTNYYASGKLSHRRYGNGVRTDYAFDPRLRLIDLQAYPDGNATSPLIHYRYRFDGASNIVRIGDDRPASIIPGGDSARNTQTFTYDDLYRLRRVEYSFNAPGAGDGDDGSIEYSYDKIGNMLSQMSTISHSEQGASLTNLGPLVYGGGTFGRSGRDGAALGGYATKAPGPHAVTRIGIPGEERELRYDDNGNVLSLGQQQFVWDFADRLIAVTGASGLRTSFVYSYSDRRVVKRSAAATVSSNASLVETTSYPTAQFEVRHPGDVRKLIYAGVSRVAAASGVLDPTVGVTQYLRLGQGWNLVSVMIDAEDTAEQIGIGSNAAIAAAYRYNGLSFDPITSMTALPAGSVLWIRATSAMSLRIVGSRGVLPPVSFGLRDFVGVNAPQGARLTEYLPPGVVRAWTFDAGSQSWRVQSVDVATFVSNAPRSVQGGGAVYLEAVQGGQIVPPSPDTSLRFFHHDHLGSADVVADGGGAPLRVRRYYPFGQFRVEAASSVEEAYEFGEKERDVETGLHYFEARYLQSALGRFISVDPSCGGSTACGGGLASPQTLNPYSYTANRPLVSVDPSGLETWPVESRAIRAGGPTAYIGSYQGRSGYKHGGIDILQARGSAVVAMAQGKVVAAGWENEKNHNKGWGRYVVIQHKGANGKNFYSLYAHLQEDLDVAVGDEVGEGTSVGRVGRTGNVKGTPDHLHLEILQGWGTGALKRMDPASIFSPLERLAQGIPNTSKDPLGRALSVPEYGMNPNNDVMYFGDDFSGPDPLSWALSVPEYGLNPNGDVVQ